MDFQKDVIAMTARAGAPAQLACPRGDRGRAPFQTGDF
jgi:hypothetical protein